MNPYNPCATNMMMPGEKLAAQWHVEKLKAEKQSKRSRITVCEEKIKALRDTVSKYKNPEPEPKGVKTI